MWALTLYRSTIGKKLIMAVTGLVLVVFVIGHMAGNLQVFIGQEKINSYGTLLHGPLAEFTWLLRIILIVSVAVVLVNLITDVVYAIVDPRIRYD